MAEGSTDITEAISKANSNLSKVKLRESGGKLYMRAIFPPKPGQKEPKRSELTTGCNATPAGLKIALEKAKQVDAALLIGKFDWGPYLQGKLKSYKPAQTVQEWAEKFEQNFWKENPRTANKEGYYHHTFRLSFNRLPQDEPLTYAVLESVLIDPDQSVPGSRMRQILSFAYRSLAAFAELPEAELKKLSQLGRGYTTKSVNPRNLPTDEEIYDLWASLENPGWKWVFSVLAIYGLRGHEIWHLRLDRMNSDPAVVEVQNETKTGWRLVYPARPGFWQDMTPEIPIYPNINPEGLPNNRLGSKIAAQFKDYGIPFTPMYLRHAYSQRMYKLGFDSYFTAKSMGHSEQIQRSVYRAWWQQETMDQRYREVMAKASGF